MVVLPRPFGGQIGLRSNSCGSRQHSIAAGFKPFVILLRSLRAY